MSVENSLLGKKNSYFIDIIKTLLGFCLGQNLLGLFKIIFNGNFELYYQQFFWSLLYTILIFQFLLSIYAIYKKNGDLNLLQFVITSISVLIMLSITQILYSFNFQPYQDYNHYMVFFNKWFYIIGTGLFLFLIYPYSYYIHFDVYQNINPKYYKLFNKENAIRLLASINLLFGFVFNLITNHKEQITIVHDINIMISSILLILFVIITIRIYNENRSKVI